MTNHSDTIATAEMAVPAEPPEEVIRPWYAAVGQLFSEAAALCVEHGVDLDVFMNGAWSAYLEARPGMRDQLEEAQLRQQLDELRKRGRLGCA